jgi:hypothetical protein
MPSQGGCAAGGVAVSELMVYCTGRGDSTQPLSYPSSLSFTNRVALVTVSDRHRADLVTYAELPS